jgi:predicted sugar kinase
LIDRLIEVKKPNLNQIINQNLGGFADIFSIVEKNLNIVDKVQLGLACKDMHTIMKPIIKKDDIHVFHCNCFEYKNNELCEVGWQRYYGGDEKMCCRDKIEKIKENLLKAGSKYASMSGTGSTVYGIFNEKPEIDWGENYFSRTFSI